MLLRYAIRCGRDKATYISGSHHTTNLFHGIQVRAETAVHGENLLVNDCSNRQAVKTVGEGLPKLDVIPAFALIIKSVDTVDASAFMVAA